MAEFLTTLFLGAVFGAIYALLAYGLVLTYRTSGVFNFAQGAVGMFFAYVFFQLVQGGDINLVVGTVHQGFKVPTLIALPLVVLVLAPAFGWGLEQVLFSKLRQAGPVVQIVATIGLLITLFGAAGVVWGSATTLTPRSLFPSTTYTAGQFRASGAEIGTVLLVFALCAGLLAFLRYSPLGVRMRAVVDRPEVSELMGVDSRRVAAFSWGLSTGFAALAGILISPFFGSLDTTTLTFLVVAATAAAVVGKLESLPLTLLGGLGLGIAQLLVKQYVHGDAGASLYSAIPFLILFVVLLLPVRWPEASTPVPARRVEPPPAPSDPGATAAVPGAFRVGARRVGVLLGVLVLPPLVLGGVLSTVLGSDWDRQIVLLPPMAIIFLSLVLLSGFGGQISLCQASFAGFGAFVAAHLVVDQGMSLLLAAPLAGLATVPLGAALAARATRLPPLFLGLATLAFAALMDEVVLTNQRFAHGLMGIAFNRPALFSGGRAYYYLTLAIFALAAVLVTNLRRGRTGLALVAMRDSQIGLASLGSSVARLKLVSFVLSAFLAGLGGALFAGASGQAASTDWIKIQSALFLALAVVGGINRWSGALVGAALFKLLPAVYHQPVFSRNVVFKFLFHGRLELLLPVFFGFGAIGLAKNAGGIIEQTREGVADFKNKQAARRAEPATAPTAVPGRASSEAAEGDLADDRPVASPRARLYHRPACALAVGKRGRAVTATRVRSLKPCPVCEPVPPAPRPAPRRKAATSTVTRGRR
ncbi:MAG: branched-chain amino acid ABC transporter permease [Acidimicrobiales bacterium]